MRALAASALLAVTASAALLAHAGPPYPILTDRIAGPYSVSIWTDPDATDDRSLGGQFWVVLETAAGGDVPPDTRATVTVTALDRNGDTQTAATEPVRGDSGNQFAAVLMDHEGPYRVRVAVTGTLGTATVESQADATYDLRPQPYMLVWYLAPFILVGLLWGRLLLKRRRARA